VGPPGSERPAVLADDGTLLDLSRVVSDIDGEFLAGDGVERVRSALASGPLPVLDGARLRIGAPVARPPKVLCIGLNYRKHAEETGAKIPAEPILFMKAANTVVGPNDEVLIPRASTKTDWEVELGVVIGRTARYLESPEAAAGVIAGDAISHDVSERAFQLERGGQWSKGKSCETFNPLGPWLVTADEVPDPQALRLRLLVNGEVKQDATTADMIYPVDEVIRWLSIGMTLLPGMLIATGTPEGVGFARQPPEFLKPGDLLESEVGGVGKLSNPCVAAGSPVAAG